VRVLVTGAGGFVGGHLLRALGEGGHERLGAVQAGYAAPSSPEGVRWLPLDVTSDDSVAEVVREARPEAVVHLAAQSSVAESFADPLGTWETNATGTFRLLNALPDGTRLLFVSSAEVYGAVPEGEQPIGEERVPRPVTPYAASKAAAEMAVLQAAARGAHVVVARSFNHTGPGHDARFALASFARQLAAIRRGEGEPVLRVGNLEARRDYLDVRDVVAAYLLLLDRGVPGRVYNVATGVAHSMRELVEMLVEVSGTGARLEVDPDRVRPVDVPLLCGDASRLRALGWEPRIPLRQTLSDLLDAAGDGAAARADVGG
jgi:GDP-4-dehydro-6-deoxy-D-mannose reductase